MSENNNLFTVVVNAQERTVTKRDLSFADVVQLGFPGSTPNDVVRYTVSYRNSDEQPPAGSLVSGQSVKIRLHGTIFDVTETHKS